MYSLQLETPLLGNEEIFDSQHDVFSLKFSGDFIVLTWRQVSLSI